MANEELRIYGYRWIILALFMFVVVVNQLLLIGLQYGAEIAYPAPEGTSNGLLLLMGQISGILFIIGMDQFKTPDNHSMTTSLVILVFLLFISFLIGTRLRESSLLRGKHAV